MLTLAALIAAGVVAALGHMTIGLACLGGALVLGLAAERFVSRRFHAWGYAEREDDLLVRRGVMFSRLSVVPYGRMQFIDVTAGPLERSLVWRRYGCTRPRPPVTHGFPGSIARRRHACAIAWPRSGRRRRPDCD